MEYKLIQGNSIEYFNNVKDLNIDLVITSPSYYTETPKRLTKDNEIGIGESKDSYIELLTNVFKGVVNNMKPNAKAIILLGRYGDLPVRSLIYELENSLNSIGLKLNNFKEFGHRHSESILVFEKGEDDICSIPEFESIQVYKKVGFFGEISNDVLTWAIDTFSNENDLIVDPFAGAGSTLKAANKLNRNSFGVELDPEYVKVGQL